jgi:hypothetical protein
VSNSSNVTGACLLGLAVTLGSGAAAGAADERTASEWLVEPRAGVVLLRLVHDERGRTDGGELLVDSNRRILLWEGIPGALGCKQKLEVPFDKVRAVRDEPEGLIRLEIKGEPRGKWVFVPLPDFAWLGQVTSPVTTGFGQGVTETLTGPDGLPLHVGGSARFAGPQTRANRVPGEVTTDVRLAVERIRQGLGRRPVPSVELYEALNGRPVEVSIGELLADLDVFMGRAVRVNGVAEPLPKGRGLKLTDEGGEVLAAPQPEIGDLTPALLRDWRGQEVEVAGVVRRRAAAAGEPPVPEIVFWEYLGPERVEGPSEEAPTVSIRDLLERPTEFAGKTVRVVGRFRGRNLEHDLKEPGPRSAWVIKSGRQAMWVTGHGPSGRGFALRSDTPQDTRKWIEVVGRPEVWKGTTLLRARAVALTAPAASVIGGPRLRTLGKPEVVFTLPLVGDDGIPPETSFLVQFSTYMDEDSFESRVRLRYGDLPEPQGELRGARWRYDEVKRTLMVDPGAPLRRGASVELVLLSGITDAWATPLLPEPGSEHPGISRILRWQVQDDTAKGDTASTQ